MTNENGQRLAEKTVPATDAGHRELHRRGNRTKTEAIRALRRRLSDEAYRRLTNDESVRPSAATALTAAAA